MRTKHPLFRHSEQLEEALFLIREQLKSRGFFNAMRAVGFDDARGEVHLEALILYMMRLDDGSDEILNFISDLLDKHSQGIHDDIETIDSKAMEIYCELLNRWKKKPEVEIAKM